VLSRNEILKILEETRRNTLDRAGKELDSIKEDEILEILVSGWISKTRKGYLVDIWRGFGRESLDKYCEIVRENAEFLDLYAKSLTPTKVLILLRAYNGATESELSEFMHLKGGALHYHLRDLVYLGLLKKEERGFYKTTRYGNFVIRSAISAIRKFRKSVEGK